MKKVMIIILLFLLSACTPPKYDRKSDDNENYYDDYLSSIGMVIYEEIDNMFSTKDMNDAYQFAGINQTSDSFFIYHYIGENTDEEKFHILIPDRVGEENIYFQDHLPSFQDLESIVRAYNASTESTEIDWAGNNTVNTNDIILDEGSMRLEVIWYLYTDRTINDVHVEADTDVIRDLLFRSLSSPFIYRIGNFYDGGNRQKNVFLAKGLDDDLVFILFDRDEIQVDIIYTYNYE